MAYCTPDDLQELGYSWDTADTANITAICDTASQLVDAYCKQSFSPPGTNYSEVHQARVRNGIIKIYPLNMIVNNIDSITFISLVTNATPFTCSNIQYMPSLGYVIAATTAPNGNYLVTLTYDFGFANGSIPADLVKATVLAAAPLLDDYFLSKDSNVSMVKSIKQGELTIQRQDTDDIPKNAKNALDGGNHGRGYVRVRAG